jgi:chromosome segregation ATPase
MFAQRLLSFLVLFTTICFANTALSQNAASEQAKLDKYQQQLSKLQAQSKQIASEISKKQAELEGLKQQSSPEQEAVDEAQQMVDQAKAEFNDTPSEANLSKITNAEFKLKLAIRKFNKANGEAGKLADDIDALSQKATTNTGDINKLQQQIAQQKTKLQQAQKRELAAAEEAKQAKLLAKQKAEAEAAKAEVERLKAMLAAQEAEKAKAAVAKAAPETKAAPAPAPVAKAAPTQAAQKVANPVVTYLTDAAEASKLIGQFNDAANANKGQNLKNLVLHIRGDKNLAITLFAAGNGIYKGKAKVRSGNTVLEVAPNTWNTEISGDLHKEFVTFIYDSSNPDAPRIVYFEAALAS